MYLRRTLTTKSPARMAFAEGLFFYFTLLLSPASIAGGYYTVHPEFASASVKQLEQKGLQLEAGFLSEAIKRSRRPSLALLQSCIAKEKTVVKTLIARDTLLQLQPKLQLDPRIYLEGLSQAKTPDDADSALDQFTKKLLKAQRYIFESALLKNLSLQQSGIFNAMSIYQDFIREQGDISLFPFHEFLYVRVLGLSVPQESLINLKMGDFSLAPPDYRQGVWEILCDSGLIRPNPLLVTGNHLPSYNPILVIDDFLKENPNTTDFILGCGHTPSESYGRIQHQFIFPLESCGGFLCYAGPHAHALTASIAPADQHDVYFDALNEENWAQLAHNHTARFAKFADHSRYLFLDPEFLQKMLPYLLRILKRDGFFEVRVHEKFTREQTIAFNKILKENFYTPSEDRDFGFDSYLVYQRIF